MGDHNRAASRVSEQRPTALPSSNVPELEPSKWPQPAPNLYTKGSAQILPATVPTLGRDLFAAPGTATETSSGTAEPPLQNKGMRVLPTTADNLSPQSVGGLEEPTAAHRKGATKLFRAKSAPITNASDDSSARLAGGSPLGTFSRKRTVDRTQDNSSLNFDSFSNVSPIRQDSFANPAPLYDQGPALLLPPRRWHGGVTPLGGPSTLQQASSRLLRVDSIKGSPVTPQRSDAVPHPVVPQLSVRLGVQAPPASLITPSSSPLAPDSSSLSPGGNPKIRLSRKRARLKRHDAQTLCPTTESSQTVTEIMSFIRTKMRHVDGESVAR